MPKEEKQRLVGNGKGSLPRVVSGTSFSSMGEMRQGMGMKHSVSTDMLEALAQRTANTIATEGVELDVELDFSEIMADAGFYLPKQGILENFVHHNPLENLQSMDFFKAVQHVHAIESYRSPGAMLTERLGSDPRTRANAALVELCAVFTDRAIAKWQAPGRERGFLYFFSSLEGLGFASWRKHARIAAKKVDNYFKGAGEPAIYAESILKENLAFYGIPYDHWAASIRATFFDLPGWAGMFQRMETKPDECPHGVPVTLLEFAAVQSILQRSSMEAMMNSTGIWTQGTGLGGIVQLYDTMTSHHDDEGDHTDFYMQNPSGLAYNEQNLLQRAALEEEFANANLEPIMAHNMKKPSDAVSQPRPVLQVWTCIDERECSIRRHLEQASGYEDWQVETFGVAGFFNLAIRYAPCNGYEEMILAPEGSKPVHRIREDQTRSQRQVTNKYMKANAEKAWEHMSFDPVGSLVQSAMFPLTLPRLAFQSMAPNTYRKISESMLGLEPTHNDYPYEADFKMPFTAEEAADRLAATFNNIGMKGKKPWAPIVAVFGHGSRTVNNPFDAAHNCGACGGREGGPNARLMARCGNDPDVRALLDQNYGIAIPSDTWFIGAYHDTCKESVICFDEDRVPPQCKAAWEQAKAIIEEAKGKSAVERCQMFMLAPSIARNREGLVPNPTNPALAQQARAAALDHVMTRSTFFGEARPELGHATNASVVIGRREITKGLHFGRRAFLPSYDPFNDDDEGNFLQRVITPALVVCSGISLEYLFSTVDGGAGTKVALNVVGMVGAMQGTTGDLQVGLPTQMTEWHAPARIMFLVDAPVSRVQAVLNRAQNLKDIVENEWVRLFVRDPFTGQLFKQRKGEYIPVPMDHLYNSGSSKETIVEQPSIERQRTYVNDVTNSEGLITGVVALGMLASFILPVMNFETMMNPRGTLIAMAATALSLMNLAFSRNYLHGEFMFKQFVILSLGLLVGFNLVACAPTLEWAVIGWNIIGFSAVFLIGAFNERPTVRENATLVFLFYEISDAALLVAAAFEKTSPEFLATGLMVAALVKTSQFPVFDLFARTMEGSSPNSGLESAALCSHAGLVLLYTTKALWYDNFTSPALVLGIIGMVTAVVAGIIAKIRADRKGSIASAVASTVGLLYIIMAFGYFDLALVLAFGHASFRMMQILRAHNIILETHDLAAALGGHSEEDHKPSMPAFAWRFGWFLLRLNSDTTLPHFIPSFHKAVCSAFTFSYSSIEDGKASHQAPTNNKFVQYSMATFILLGAGIMPSTPISDFLDEQMTAMLQSDDYAYYIGLAFIALVTFAKTVAVWHLLAKVLSSKRFVHSAPETTKQMTVEYKNMQGANPRTAQTIG